MADRRSALPVDGKQVEPKAVLDQVVPDPNDSDSVPQPTCVGDAIGEDLDRHRR
jgi:hypothetical protein